jgi:hypothetical protein
VKIKKTIDKRNREMNLKTYWRKTFHESGYGITKIACHAIDMEWPPIKGWLKHKGHIIMTPELIGIFERHIPCDANGKKNFSRNTYRPRGPMARFSDDAVQAAVIAAGGRP